MNKQYTVLSLFDGISVGQLSLKELNINISNYYASEIEQSSMDVTEYNFPETIFIGDVRKINTKELPKIDLLIGGSPCQNFSFAGKKKGMVTKTKEEILTLDRYLQLKKDEFEFEGQSYLFWEYIRILKELQKKNPNIKFFLENVKMSQKWRDVITENIKVFPTLINSKIVSAQNRERLYWTNIVEQEQINIVDRKVRISDVIDKNIPIELKKIPVRNKVLLEKNNNIYLCAAMRGRYVDKSKTVTKQMLEIRDDQKTNAITTVQKDNILIFIQDNICYSRNFTELELERLQTLPDNYTKFSKQANIPKTKRKKMIGNSWTKNIVKLFFIHLKK